jgi:nicotinamide mononucleotide transporter
MHNPSLEWLAATTGLVSVILTARRSVLSWPVGLISVIAFLGFFFHIKLYADSALQCFYLVTGLYGWWHWARGGPNKGRALIKVLSLRNRALWIVAMAIGAIATAWFLSTRTDSTTPRMDALVTCLSIAAQLLMMRKILESWIVWILIDVLSLWLYSAKQAWVTLGLHAIYLGIATVGLFAWSKALARGEKV